MILSNTRIVAIHDSAGRQRATPRMGQTTLDMIKSYYRPPQAYFKVLKYSSIPFLR